jgi:hypothetical protein
MNKVFLKFWAHVVAHIAQVLAIRPAPARDGWANNYSPDADPTHPPTEAVLICVHKHHMLLPMLCRCWRIGVIVWWQQCQ